MKIIKFILLFMLFVVLLTVSYVNTKIVDFSIPYGSTYKLPLIVLLFIAFVIGALLGILSMLTRILCLRKQAATLNKELTKSQDSISKLMSNQSTSTIIVKDKITPNQNNQ